MRGSAVFHACWGRWMLRVAFAAAFCVSGAFGQTPNAASPEADPLGPPSELGFRLTPDMARLMAKQIVTEFFIGHHGMDPSKADDAIELIARRIMAAAHASGEQGQALAEWFTAEGITALASYDYEVTAERGKGLADRMMPLIPTVRDAFRGVGQDITPLLPLKEQLKFSGELVLAGTTLDALEKNMQRWARGEARPGEQLFEPDGRPQVKREPDGKSRTLKGAQKQAKGQATEVTSVQKAWGDYLEEAKKYYALDAAQCATADAVFREYLERAQVLGQDQAWSEALYRLRFWQQFVWSARMDGAEFFYALLRFKLWDHTARIDQLRDELRSRLDEIPTEAQKRAAEARIDAALAAQGLPGSREAK